jgi:hypothetical protein
MQSQTDRIPDLSSNTFDGMLLWFGEMSVRGLIFHPENLPEQQIHISDGSPFFTPQECRKLDGIISEMNALHGDRVIDACYPIFMKAAGFPDFDA